MPINIGSWPDFCKFDVDNSPVNIIKPFTEATVGISFQFGLPKDKVKLINDGIKPTIVGKFGEVHHGDHIYYVELINVHHPSEHTVHS